MSSSEGRVSTRRKTVLLLLMAVVAVLYVVRGWHNEQHFFHLFDFKQPYASARCLLHGCNPYSESDTQAEYLRAGGIDYHDNVFRPNSALYPPFTFALLTPIAALDFPTAHNVWFALIAVLYSTAILLTADLCLGLGTNLVLAVPAVLLLMFFTFTSMSLLMLGQISGPVISLLVIGFWCLLREKFMPVAVLAFTVALILKPHDSALAFCYLLFAGSSWRRCFLYSSALTLAVALGGIAWCSHQPASAHWLADLQSSLHGNATSGDVNDPASHGPGPINLASLQPLFAVLNPNPHVYSVAAALVSLTLLGAWAAAVARKAPSFGRHLLAIASITVILLLPVYHRQYDGRILLLTFPAALLLLRWRPRSWGPLAMLLLAMGTVMTSNTYINWLSQRAQAEPNPGTLKLLLLYRPLPAIELTLAVFLVAAFHVYTGSTAERARA